MTNVARASLEELLTDYQDFLRARKLALWAKDSLETLFIRRLGRRGDESFATYRSSVESRPAEVVANIALCLGHQVNYALNAYLRGLEKAFLAHGGLGERMTRVRLVHRAT